MSTSSIQPSKGISIVIPNYNGEGLLRDNLPSVFAAIAEWRGPAEVIIIDDCSRDGSCQLIREEFPAAKLLINPHNMGFSRTCNRGMAATVHPIVLCINTDVKVEANLLETLAGHFTDPEVFAVSPRILVERESKNQGAIFGRYRNGFIKGSFAAIDEQLPTRENIYAIGACVAYDAAKFRALGGYCEIFTPYLFEDVDISYRAWKRGWKSIYEPNSRVWHYSNATIAKAKRRVNKKIYFRNRFIFHWINLSDPSKVFLNGLHTFIRLLVCFIWGNFVYYEAFFSAVKQWKAIKYLRMTEKQFRTLHDAEIIRRTTRNIS